MNKYKRTQMGTLTIVLMGISLMIMFFVYAFARIGLSNPRREDVGGLANQFKLQQQKDIYGLMIFVASFALACFYNLTVLIDETHLRISFGIGLIRRSFPLAEIKSVEVVRNRWFYGWGVRWYFYGWLYNVSGFDAIEIVMRSGKRYRIGTDEPQKLAAAVIDCLKN